MEREPLKVRVKSSSATEAAGVAGRVGTVVAVSPCLLGLPPMLVVEFGPDVDDRYHIREPLCEIVK